MHVSEGGKGGSEGVGLRESASQYVNEWQQGSMPASQSVSQPVSKSGNRYIRKERRKPASK